MCYMYMCVTGGGCIHTHGRIHTRARARTHTHTHTHTTHARVTIKRYSASSGKRQVRSWRMSS